MLRISRNVDLRNPPAPVGRDVVFSIDESRRDSGSGGIRIQARLSDDSD